jgi:uncharacterized protein (DUF433 family)
MKKDDGHRKGNANMVVAPIDHICLDERGTAYIAGTSLKVAAIAIDAVTWEMTPQQIQENYPKLSLAQIHAALAYYYDHQAEIDAQLAAWDAEYEKLRTANPNPLTREQLEERLQRRQSSEPA